MASTVITAPVASRSSTRPLGSIVGQIRRWIAYRQTVSALNELSRRELADIGVESVDEFAWRLASDNARL